MNKTEISNLALSHARETLISGNVETTTELIAETVLLHYEQSLREMLGRVRPSFAQTRKLLTEDANAPAFGWDNQFVLPVDYVEMVRFNGDDVSDVDDFYEIEGRRLMTDEEAAYIIYIRYEEDTSLYDAEFIAAFSLALAAKIVDARRGDAERAQALAAMAESKASESSAKSAHARKRYNSRDKMNRGSRWTGTTRRVSTNESANGTSGVIID